MHALCSSYRDFLSSFFKIQTQSTIMTSNANVEPIRMEDLLRKKSNFHKPGENAKTDGYVTTPNTTKLIEKHLKETGGKVIR